MLDNFTPFGAAASFAYELDDSQVVVMAVAAAFRLPPAGRVHEGPLTFADEQPPPPMADRHFDNPASSTLRVPGQGTPLRPRPEIYLHGSARPPRGRAVTHLRTGVRVGACRKEADVVGERFWSRGLGAPTPSEPAPFTRMPLVYERAFGGTLRGEGDTLLAQDARNPIGRGLHGSAAAALDQPLPNVEKPGESMQGWSDRLTPWGYAPVPGAWQPRLAYAGTYDAHWTRERLPLWPRDVDRRFFNAAAPGLVLDRPLAGEQVVLQGFDPDGYIAFTLPRLQVLAKSYFGDRVERCLMALGAVLFDVDARLATLFWHHAVPLGRGRQAHLRSSARLLEPWETPP